MPPDVSPGAARAHALLAGSLGGIVAEHGPEAGRAALEAARILAEELLVPEPALDGLARRWAHLGGTAALDTGTARGLAHLALGRGPRPASADGERATLPALLPPLALLTFDSPRNLLSVSWHVAALTHPSEEARWAAVAVNVALARFLQGHRDFVPDVIEALRNNDAPAPLLALARRLPVLSRTEILALAGAEAPAVADAITALWLAEREPIVSRGVAFLNDGSLGTALPAMAALLGARDGNAARLGLDLPAPNADIRALALRLARLPQP